MPAPPEGTSIIQAVLDRGLLRVGHIDGTPPASSTAAANWSD
jgi:hypothetical protein